MSIQPFIDARVRALCLPVLLLGAVACVGAEAPPPPADAPRVPSGYGTAARPWKAAHVEGERLTLPGDWKPGAPLALELKEQTLMAELSGPLSQLGQQAAGKPVCLVVAAGPDADVRPARRCVLFQPMSGEQFGAWLDAVKPAGKIRLVMRTDGIEVVTDRGKVPGPDRYGPSVPPINGRPDFEGLELVLKRLKARFPDEEEAVLAPSAGLPVAQVARALALLNGAGGGRFAKLYLVYP